MKQLEIIRKLKSVLKEDTMTDAAMLYGSFARQSQGPNSDIDVAVSLRSKVDPEVLRSKLRIVFANILVYDLHVDLKRKLVFYFKDSPKLEIEYNERLEAFERNLKGSLLTRSDIDKMILYDTDGAAKEFLSALLSAKPIYKKDSLASLISRFMYEFESCSEAHRRSDGYRFYYFYNIALEQAIKILHQKVSDGDFNYLPKNFTTKYIGEEHAKEFFALNGSMFLPEANEKKRRLLDFFYDAIENQLDRTEYEAARKSCEFIFNRDYYWNFRDVSKFNETIRVGSVFRSSSLSLISADDAQSLLNRNRIGTIVDLRAPREVDQIPYSKELLEQFEYVLAPMDPWNQPEDFKKAGHFGDNFEIAYKFFLLACNESILKVFRTLLEAETGVIVHCHAGKDRTGIVFTLLHMLMGASNEAIWNDYIASEMDLNEHLFKIIGSVVEGKGGIEQYLINIGLQEEELELLKLKYHA